MVTKADYGQREVEACKAVLVELVHLLGEFRDICFCLRHHPGGVENLIKEFDPHIGDGLVKEGLAKIAMKFASPNQIGPRQVADFESVTDVEERARIERDAFERVDYLLRRLGIVNP